MHGPFMLPENIREGDWIEIGQLGAYGACLRTSFNGFDRAVLAEVRDRAMLETAGYQDGDSKRSVHDADAGDFGNVTKLPFDYPRAA